MSKRRSPKGRGNHFRRRSPKKADRAPNEKKGRSLQGRVQKNSRGFAFIVPRHAEFEDVFVGKEEAASLLDGDTVEFTIQQRGARSSARILRVVSRRQNRVVGKVTLAGRGLAVVTANNEYFTLKGESRKANPGEWVVAELTEFPDTNHPGAAELLDNFGKTLSPKNDIAYTVARYGLYDRFSEGVLREAERYRTMAEKEIYEGRNRKDQRGLPYVTIDGEDAKDFDDAVFVECPQGHRGYVLYVAIADVSFFVRPGTALDKEAKARATSVYFPGFCLPMLPEFLSNDLCSLRPQEEKLAVTAEMYFSETGQVQSTRFYPSLIRTVRRLTYTQVQAFFDKDAEMQKELEPLAPHLNNALALFHKLDQQRRGRGVLDFDLPECKIQVDKEGFPISVLRAPRFASHKLIEEFMIAANRAVAEELREGKALALYRVHEAPDAQSLDELNLLLRNLGLPGHVQELSPKAFAKVLESTAELKSASTVHQVILRLQKQARYMALPKGHFGLALADYTHFTSPIRRYPDLVVHRSLKQLTARSEKTDKRSEEMSADDYVRLGEHTSDMERRATEAERFIVRRKQCWYFKDRVGETFKGTVSGVTKNGVFMELGEMAAEGFIPLEFLEGFYVLDERHMCLRKRPGNAVIALGDTFNVQVVKVSVDENQITLGMEGE